MKRKRKLYDLFFPAGRRLPFRKLRWTIMIIIQEMMMCKWKAIAKFYYKKSYRADIKVLRDILSKGKLKGTKTTVQLCNIHFSHEINYPEWVDKLAEDLRMNPQDYKRIKVFNNKGKYIVIDGNHRLQAMVWELHPYTEIEVLLLSYQKE